MYLIGKHCLAFSNIPKVQCFALLQGGGGEIAQSLASLFTKRVARVRARLNRLSLKGGILSLCYVLAPTSADDWLKKGRSCVIMSV